jgi:hypothetical protein
VLAVYVGEMKHAFRVLVKIPEGRVNFRDLLIVIRIILKWTFHSI